MSDQSSSSSVASTNIQSTPTETNSLQPLEAKVGTNNESKIIENNNTDSDEIASSSIDPFLTPGKSQSSSPEKISTDDSKDSVNITATSYEKPTQSASFSIDELGSDSSALYSKDQTVSSTNLDSMIANLDTTVDPTNVLATTNLGDLKKKKMLLVGTGILGLIILGLVSYLVFTTMFPVETNTISDTVNNLQANVVGGAEQNTEGPTGSSNQGVPIQEGETTTDAASGGDSASYTPGQENTTILNTTTPSENTTAQGFGSEDELPLGSEPISTSNTSNDSGSTTSSSSPTTTNDTNSNPDELPTVSQSPEKVSQELTNKIDQAKQLLALIKTKGNNVDQMKTLAGLIKEIKAIQLVIKEGTYSSFTDSVEKPLSDLSFRFDKLTSEVVGQ